MAKTKLTKPPTKTGIYWAVTEGIGAGYNYFDGTYWYTGWTSLGAFKMPSTRQSPLGKSDIVNWQGKNFSAEPFTLQDVEDAAYKEEQSRLRQQEIIAMQKIAENGRLRNEIALETLRSSQSHHLSNSFRGF